MGAVAIGWGMAPHPRIAEVAELAHLQDWRPGAKQALQVLEHLDPDARSVKESESRAVLVFAGLPHPEVNLDIRDSRGELLGCGDLVLPVWKVLVEYEGRQHEDDIAQWNADIDRYRGFRDAGWRYVQVTHEKLMLPQKLVSEVYGQLLRAGYDDPAPVFGTRWRSLFAPMRATPRRGRWAAHLSTSSKGA